jgi:hypothetical protein
MVDCGEMNADGVDVLYCRVTGVMQRRKILRLYYAQGKLSEPQISLIN